MPQDSLRSRIYKSFLTCNDPKGIVDCSTVRKPNVGTSEMEKRNKSRTRKNSYESVECEFQKEKATIKGVVDEFDSSSSFQLMEVSRGAQKLKQTIDLWSNEVKCHRQSEEIARDLFEGALDLQESLVMLHKLQEASWYMTQMKRKEQIGRRRTASMDTERTCLNRYEFQKARLSADYSYGKGAEELKTIIRDRLAKKILVPNTTHEKTCFPDRNTENLGSEIASTSSSQSSMVYTTAANTEKKGGGKYLIAKLMGLEIQSEKRQQTLISDHQLAEAKKPKSVVEKTVERKSSLETNQFKGILKHSAKETNQNLNHSKFSHSREEFTHAALPIVLLKPLPVSQIELEESRARMVREDEALNKKSFIKLKMKEKYPQKEHDMKVEALSSKEVVGSMGAEETRKEAQNPKKEHWKPKECVSVIKSEKRASHISLNQNLQRREAVDKKVLGRQKEIVIRKNSVSQAKIVQKFQKQVQGPPRKLQAIPNGRDEFIPQDSISTSDTASERSLLKNQAIKEKVINEVTVDKSVAVNFGGRSDNKKPDETKSPASLLQMRDIAGGSKSQICDCCSLSQTSLPRPCRRPETESETGEEACKYIDHGQTEIRTGTNLKAPISGILPSTDRGNELFHPNLNGSSSITTSPDESTENICDAMDSWRNCGKKEMRQGFFGLSWRSSESMDEAEEVVEDLERRILVGLIQEVFTCG